MNQTIFNNSKIMQSPWMPSAFPIQNNFPMVNAPYFAMPPYSVQKPNYAAAPATYPYYASEKRPRVEGPPPESAAPQVDYKLPAYPATHNMPDREATYYSEPPSSSSVQVRMFGLSPAVTREDIMDFFRDFDPVQESIKLVVDRQGCMTGVGILRFNSPNDARNAVVTLNNRHLLNGPISLQLD